MYEADENCVYYCNAREDTRELFLTVHPTKDCSKTTKEQATVLARILNSDASTRYRIVGGA